MKKYYSTTQEVLPGNIVLYSASSNSPIEDHYGDSFIVIIKKGDDLFAKTIIQNLYEDKITLKQINQPEGEWERITFEHGSDTLSKEWMLIPELTEYSDIIEFTNTYANFLIGTL